MNKFVQIILKIIIFVFIITTTISIFNRFYTFVINFNKGLAIATITKMEYYDTSGGDSSSSTTAYYIKINQEDYYGSYISDKSDFEIEKGDTITYRIVYENKKGGGIRAVKLNGKKIQSKYGIADVFTIFTIFLIPLTIYFIPKVKKTILKQQNKKIHNRNSFN